MKKIKIILLALFTLSSVAFTAYTQEINLQKTVENAVNNYDINNPVFNAFSEEIFNAIYRVDTEGTGPYKGKYFDFHIYPCGDYDERKEDENKPPHAHICWGEDIDEVDFFIIKKENDVIREDYFRIFVDKSGVPSFFWAAMFSFDGKSYDETTEAEPFSFTRYIDRDSSKKNFKISFQIAKGIFNKTSNEDYRCMMHMALNEDRSGAKCDIPRIKRSDGYYYSKDKLQINFSEPRWQDDAVSFFESPLFALKERHILLDDKEKEFSKTRMSADVAYGYPEIERILKIAGQINFSDAKDPKTIAAVTNIFYLIGKIREDNR